MTEALEKAETRGRPKLPENLIKELREKIAVLENQIRDNAEPQKQVAELAETIRLIMRAIKGLDPREDHYLGLIDVADIRERTRLDETALLSHSAMRVLAKEYPEMSLFGKIADMEDPYYISEDGLGRQEGIAIQNAKTRLDAANVFNMNPSAQNLPEQQPGPTQPKKKGLIDKIFRR